MIKALKFSLLKEIYEPDFFINYMALLRSSHRISTGAANQMQSKWM